MTENGFAHSAFVFETEAMTNTTNIATSQIPPNTLITLLQKSLLYMELEKSIHQARSDPKSTIAKGIWAIEEETKRIQEEPQPDQQQVQSEPTEQPPEQPKEQPPEQQTE